LFFFVTDFLFLNQEKEIFEKQLQVFFFLRLADSIFCRSVLVLSLLIGFFKPRAAHIRRFAVNEVVCGRVLYG
jgi:hypothetical protein